MTQAALLDYPAMRIKRAILTSGELAAKAFSFHHVIFTHGADWHIRTDESTFERVSHRDVCVIPAGRVRTARFHEPADNLVILMPTIACDAGSAPMFDFGHRLLPIARLRAISSLLMDEAQRGYRPNAQAYIDSLHHILSTNVLDALAVTPGPSMMRARLTNRQLRDIEDFVESHLAAELSLHRLAAVVHLSPYYFARTYRASTGESAHAFVSRRRFARALRLLTASDPLPIKEIARRCGFQSASHFTAFFRARSGNTPSDVRRYSK